MGAPCFLGCDDVFLGCGRGGGEDGLCSVARATQTHLRAPQRALEVAGSRGPVVRLDVRLECGEGRNTRLAKVVPGKHWQQKNTQRHVSLKLKIRANEHMNRRPRVRQKPSSVRHVSQHRVDAGADAAEDAGLLLSRAVHVRLRSDNNTPNSSTKVTRGMGARGYYATLTVQTDRAQQEVHACPVGSFNAFPTKHTHAWAPE